MKLIFLHADKHESLLQIDTMTFTGMAKHSQSSQQYLKEEVKDKVNSLHVHKQQSFLQVDLLNLGIKVPTL